MVRDLRTEIRSDLRAESRSQALKEVIAEAIGKLEPIKIDCNPIRHSEEVEANDRSLVVALGDFHYGADITVMGFEGEVVNSYSPSIFDEYMRNLMEQLIDIVIKEQVSNIVVMFVGDLIDGMLRDSQLMRLKLGIVDSTISLSEYLASWLVALAEYTERRVEVYACTGNHSEIRPLGSKARQFEDENMERIIMWFLRQRLMSSSRVLIHPFTDRRVLAKVQGYNFLLLHGDGASYKTISEIARDTVNLYGKSIDYFVCGHLHNEASIQSGKTKDGQSYIIRVPSFCGMDGYAQSKELGGDPGAIAMVIEKGYGRRCVYPIRVKY